MLSQLFLENKEFKGMDESWLPVFENSLVKGILPDLDQIYDSNGDSELVNVDKKINIYPPKELVYSIFTTPVSNIKLVVLGQDPYPKYGEAHGYSFSVLPGILVPPSLRNIFKEIQQNFPERNYQFSNRNGCLIRWNNEEGICLLNSALTVKEGSKTGHMKLWEKFTDEVIRFISKETDAIFLLLGNFARSKRGLISEAERRVIEAPHPSPLAKGFIGSKVFIEIEKRLGHPINWNI